MSQRGQRRNNVVNMTICQKSKTNLKSRAKYCF